MLSTSGWCRGRARHTSDGTCVGWERDSGCGSARIGFVRGAGPTCRMIPSGLGPVREVADIVNATHLSRRRTHHVCLHASSQVLTQEQTTPLLPMRPEPNGPMAREAYDVGKHIAPGTMESSPRNHHPSRSASGDPLANERTPEHRGAGLSAVHSSTVTACTRPTEPLLLRATKHTAHHSRRAHNAHRSSRHLSSVKAVPDQDQHPTDGPAVPPRRVSGSPASHGPS